MNRPEAAESAAPRARSVPRPPGPARPGRPDRASTYGRSPVAPRPRTPSGPARSPGTRPRPAGATASGQSGGASGRATGGAAVLRLTGRGAILGLFVLMFLGSLISGWLGTGVLADLLFLLGCGAMAWYTKPADLLSVSVSPPLAFFFACVLAKLITSSGGTSAAEGTLVTLATSAPWLFAGTALTIAIALRRGLLDNLRDLRAGLQGTAGAPAGGQAARPDERARPRWPSA
jgi:hypothetical protein